MIYICLQYLCEYIEKLVTEEAQDIYNVSGKERITLHEFRLDKKLLKVGRLTVIRLKSSCSLDAVFGDITNKLNE